MLEVNNYKEIRSCKECNKTFIAWKCRRTIYCCLTCKRLSWSKLEIYKTRTAEVFKKISKTISGRKRPEISGSKCYKWKGGRSKCYKTGYYSLKYKKWRKSVFERDEYTCKECNIKGVYLTAHHIKSFAHYPKLRFDLSNGKTLCESCHSKTDNYKGRCKSKLNK